jgi:hypothetical protein
MLRRIVAVSETRFRILRAVLEAVDEVNELLPSDRRIPRNAAAALAGPDGHLDSLGLANLILAAEEKISDALGKSVVLTDEANLFEPDGPCASVQQLTNHVALKFG